MKNNFSVFYDTEVKIFEAQGVSSYGSDAEMTYKKAIFADVQPYSSWQTAYGLNDREFSLSDERRMRMYFNSEDIEFVRVGNYAEIDGAMYRIEYVNKRGMGAEAAMKECIL